MCLRCCSREVWRTSTRSRQPSARCALGDNPSGLLAHTHEILAPMMLVNRPLMVFQPWPVEENVQQVLFSITSLTWEFWTLLEYKRQQNKLQKTSSSGSNSSSESGRSDGTDRQMTWVWLWLSLRLWLRLLLWLRLRLWLWYNYGYCCEYG